MARPRTDIQPRLIASARKCFAESGVDGSSLREIARGAKTSIGMVYYYFPTKDELFHAVVEDVYAKLLADLQHILVADVSVEERILHLYQRMGQASDLEILTLRLIFQEMLVSPVRRARLLDRFKRGHLALVQGTLAEGIKQGRLRKDRSPPVLLLGTLAIGAVPQLVLRALGAQGGFGQHPSGEALAKELLSMLLQGIGEPKPAAAVSRKERRA